MDISQEIDYTSLFNQHIEPDIQQKQLFLKSIHDILRTIDIGECVFLVLLDLSAAFDTVAHQILLDRLRTRFGIVDDALQWLKSYLQDRTQAVVISGASSSPVPLTCGVPQGSVLGPDLFTNYSSPIASIIRSFGVSVHCYADDTQVHCSFTPGVNELEVRTRLEQCIDKLRDWMSHNMLKLNDSKTEFIIFGSSSLLDKVNTHSIRIGQCDIEAVSSVRNIGAMFDSQLKMEVQVRHMCKNAWYNLYRISKVRQFLTLEQTKTAVHAYVTSKIDYNNSLLSGVPACILRRLQVVQNSAAKVMTRIKKFDHVTPILKDLHWLPSCQSTHCV